MDLTWPELLLAFLLCHLVGDFLLQTDSNARHKRLGLSRDPLARRALLTHIFTYTGAFVPAIAWHAGEAGAWSAALAVVLIALPHALVDDGRLVAWHLRTVKQVPGDASRNLAISVDQSMHAVCLWAAAVLLTLA